MLKIQHSESRGFEFMYVQFRHDFAEDAFLVVPELDTAETSSVRWKMWLAVRIYCEMFGASLVTLRQIPRDRHTKEIRPKGMCKSTKNN